MSEETRQNGPTSTSESSGGRAASSPASRAIEPLVIPRAEHPISRKKISQEALKVLYGLYRAGFKAYLVGGSVRDLMLKREPKDFDIATDASPQQVKRLFRNARIIGRRFRVVHVRFGADTVIEVSTFRRQPEEFELEEGENGETILPESGAEEEAEGGEVLDQIQASALRRRRMNENTFGSEQEDALRRDLTINGLFYDIGSFSVIDYVGGLKDLADGVIRTIGDPDVRFEEDPVRIIRAIRHAARTGFVIEPQTAGAIRRHHEHLKACAPARVFEEILRELRGGSSYESFKLMVEMTVLSSLFPPLAEHLVKFPAADPQPGDDWYRLQILDRLRAERGPLQDSILIAHLMLPLLSEPINAASSGTTTRAQASGYLSAVVQGGESLAQALGIPRRLGAAATSHIVGLCRIRRALATGGLAPTMRQKSYFEEAFTLYELDAISRGEQPVDIERLPIAQHTAGTGRRRRPRKRRRGKKRNG